MSGSSQMAVMSGRAVETIATLPGGRNKGSNDSDEWPDSSNEWLGGGDDNSITVQQE